MRYLRQNTAVTVVVGPMVDYGNGKSVMRDNDDFDPSAIVCELIKGSSSSELTLTKTGGDNDINLTGKGLATLELTAANVDTAGQLRISFTDALVDGYPTQTILPFAEDFTVLAANIYDALIGSDILKVDIEQVKGGAIAGVNDFKADVTGMSTFDPLTDTVIVGNTDACKADVSNLSTFDPAVDTVIVGNTEACKADVSGLSTFDPLTDTVIVSNTEDCKADLTSLEGMVEFLRDVAEADGEVDTTTTPWNLVIKHKTTGAELIRKELQTITGADITSVRQVIGRHAEP